MVNLKKALVKDGIIEIKKTFKRFLSILLIVLLGVGFFAGIKAASPDMEKTADTYFDEQNLMDIEVLSTLGLTGEDVNRIKQIEGVEAVYPTYSTDAIVEIEEKDTVVKVHSLPKENTENAMNQVKLVEGRMPEKENECLVETSFLTLENHHIGDTIKINAENNTKQEEKNESKEESRSFLKVDTMTIVGTIESPLYISRERGSSKLGAGKILYYLYVPEEAIDSDIYTEIYVTVKGAKEEDSFQDSYTDKIKEVKDKIEEIREERRQARYEEVVGEANRKLEEAQEEYAEKKEDALNEIEEGKQALEEAKITIKKAETEYEKGKKELEKQIKQGQEQLKKAERQIQEKEKELAQAEEQWNAQSSTVKEKQKELEENRKALESGINTLQTQKDALRAQIKTVQKNITNLEEKLEAATEAEKKELQKQIETQKSTLSALQLTEKQVSTKLLGLQTNLKQVEEGISQIREVLKTENQLVEGRKKIEKGKAQHTLQKNKLEQAKKQGNVKLEQAKKQIEEGKAQIAENESKLKEGQKETEAKLQEAQNELDDAKDKIKEIQKPDWYILDREQNAGIAGYKQDCQRIANIGKVFPVVFFVVAALISLTSMTRMVEEQRVQIGTLKALGYNKVQIASKYMLYAFLATIVGGLIGTIIGLKVLPNIIFTMYRMMYTLPPLIAEFNMYYTTLGIGIALLCTCGATIFSCIFELTSTPAELMRPKAPKPGKRVLLERIPFIWKRMKFTQKVTARNLFRYKKRFLMTIIGICGCTSLIVAGFGLKDSITEMVPIQYNDVLHYDMQVMYKEDTKREEIQQQSEEIKQRPEIKQSMLFNKQAGKLSKDGKQEEIQIMIPKEKEQMAEYITLQSRLKKQQYQLDNETVIITEKVAKILGIKEGDTIYLQNADDKQVEAKVSHITENYLWHYVYMSPDLYQKLYGENVKFNMVLAKTEELTSEQQDKVSKEILGNNTNTIASVEFIKASMSMIDDMMSNMNYVVWILIGAAGLLAFVVLYNLSNVNISERIRELATIKVLGFYDKEVYRYVTKETIILTILGIIFGILGGILLNTFIINTCELDMLMFNKRIEPISFIYGALITLIFASFVNIATYFRLKKIDMIESLKSIE